ncbi:MAG: universal stress protein [Novosphingobium sp.]|uniref:universal stress protein n=1 Tax=Novosphingobium sp. TaxID=1874826 RepID=UPI0032BEB995
MRVYLVIMDETEEAATALRFAASRALRTKGQVHLLALVPRQQFVAFGGIQATIEEEARARAEALVTSAAGSLMGEGGLAPVIAVKQGEGVAVIREYLLQHPETSALVLGAASSGAPGPLVSHFASVAGQLPCPLYVIPGALSAVEIERLS